MIVKELQTPQEYTKYTEWLTNHTQNSIWQSLHWKTFQESLGRNVRLYVAMNEERILASALVVIDTTTFGYSVWNIPRGPVFTDQANANALVDFIVSEAKKEKCLQVYLSPFAPLSPTSFIISSRHEQPEATIVIDLTKSDEEILDQMKPKGRYNIRVAEKHNVQVQQSSDASAFHALLTETSKRDAFGIHAKSYYEAFLQLPDSFLLLAYTDDHTRPIAGLLGLIYGDLGIYYYGASSYAARSLMAPYALQWQAMQYCKQKGCTTYDLLGVAPQNTSTKHPWHGITAFKEKFGGMYRAYPHEQVTTLQPVLTKLLQIKRKLMR